MTDLDETGMTALGPAVTICSGLVSDSPASEIILCTDGEPNVGVGSLDGFDRQDGPAFYRKVLYSFEKRAFPRIAIPFHSFTCS